MLPQQFLPPFTEIPAGVRDEIERCMKKSSVKTSGIQERGANENQLKQGKDTHGSPVEREAEATAATQQEQA